MDWSGRVVGKVPFGLVLLVDFALRVVAHDAHVDEAA